MEWNDVVPYEWKWLMDQKLNVEKMAEEGHPSAAQLLWGLHMDFELPFLNPRG